MREKPTKTEKDYLPKNFHPTAQQWEMEKEYQPPKTENPSEHMLKLAALLKKWKKQRKIFWMKVIMYSFFVSYILLLGFPVYLAWAEKLTFREGFSREGKIFLTFACTAMAVAAIVAGWGSYKKWEKKNA